MEPTLDFTLHGSGTLYLLTPLTDDAREWVKLHIPEDAQRLGRGIAIEWRYVDDIMVGIEADGLTAVRS